VSVTRAAGKRACDTPASLLLCRAVPQSSLWATTLGPCWVDVEGRSGLKSLRTSTASASGALDMQPEGERCEQVCS
jgi:hypothetical protein